MKLSKNNLKTLLRHSAWDDLAKACEDDTLEIEGYERVQWSRFDPKNTKTLSKKFKRVLFSMDGVIMCGTIQDMLTAKWRGAEQIYWRQSPKPPAEREEQNEKKA